MRKTTKKIVTTIGSRDELETVLGRFAELTLQGEALKIDMEERIRQVREEYETRFTQIDADSNLLLADMNAWAALHPEEFETRKSLELVHGVIGFRTGTPKVSLPKGVKDEDVVSEMLDAGDCACFLRTSTELDKQKIIAACTAEDETMASASTEMVSRFGVKVTQSERFFADIKRENGGAE